MKPKIMLIGLGDLGSVVLELLARETNLGSIVVGSQNTERGLARCNLARLAATVQDFKPDVNFIQLDMHNKEAVAETIHLVSPDLIIFTATMLPWWLLNQLPPEQAAAIKRAGFGVWLPVHLTLTMKLMQAVRDAHYKGFTLTAPFPDVVNCILGKLDLAPTCGVGNLNEIVPKLHLLAAKRLNTKLERVRVFLVAHHALRDIVFRPATEEVPTEIPPYYLRIEHDGQDVTAAVQADELLLTPYPLTPGPAIHFLTAGCIVQLVRALFSDEQSFIHVPAPDGLPGGYPVMVSKQGVQPVTLPGLTLNEAIAINEQSHSFNGIERIETDGTAVFCPDSAAALRETLGYDCNRLPPNETETRARELIARFKEYAKRYGLSL